MYLPPHTALCTLPGQAHGTCLCARPAGPCQSSSSAMILRPPESTFPVQVLSLCLVRVSTFETSRFQQLCKSMFLAGISRHQVRAFVSRRLSIYCERALRMPVRVWMMRESKHPGLARSLSMSSCLFLLMGRVSASLLLSPSCPTLRALSHVRGPVFY